MQSSRAFSGASAITSELRMMEHQSHKHQDRERDVLTGDDACELAHVPFSHAEGAAEVLQDHVAIDLILDDRAAVSTPFQVTKT
jgi:hypothetical protein